MHTHQNSSNPVATIGVDIGKEMRVSSQELDVLVDIAQRRPGVLGARSSPVARDRESRA